MKKIWMDPVWSKVISAVIISICGFFFTAIYSLITELSLTESIRFMWNYKIGLGPTILTVIILILIAALIQKIQRKSPSKLQKLKDKFHNTYKKFEDPTHHVRYRFNAYVSSQTKFPFISDLRIYCIEHGKTETLMNRFTGCPIPQCSKHNVRYNEKTIKEQIETELLIDWEKMNQ